MTCPFCSLEAERIWLASTPALAVFDGFPISDGHTLVIPKQHVASVFDLSPDEQLDLWSFVSQVRCELKKRFGVEAFNIGINDGALAGQTVLHAHIHVIPRRNGDVDDPRGGIRWVIPSKAKYWK